MSKPYEVIAAPFTVYRAPVGTAFPLIGAAPASDWVKIGTSGDRSQTEEGVTVSHRQAINAVRAAGSTGPIKAFRNEEDLMVAFTLMDLSLEAYAMAMNGNAVSTTAAGVGTAGYKALKLYRGASVTLHALLIRGAASAYGDGWSSQYQIPVCFQSGDAEPVFTKGEPAGIALEFTALEDPDAASADLRFGQIIMQHATAL